MIQKGHRQCKECVNAYNKKNRLKKPKGKRLVICSSCGREAMVYFWKKQCPECQSALNRKRYSSDPKYQEKAASYYTKLSPEKKAAHWNVFKERSQKKYREDKAVVDGYLMGHSCVKCGESNIRVLDFHHRDKGGKIFTVASEIGKRPIEEIFSEVEKCDVLCANCHKATHFEEYQDRSSSSRELTFREKQIRDRQVATRLFMYEYLKKHSCVKCGKSDFRNLCFHHRKPEEKLFNVGESGPKYSREKLIVEMEKCDILCANCHRLLHWNEKHVEPVVEDVCDSDEGYVGVYREAM
jgi:hypothetical protein